MNPLLGGERPSEVEVRGGLKPCNISNDIKAVLWCSLVFLIPEWNFYLLNYKPL